MPKYRSKPTEVEAWQWNGMDLPFETPQWVLDSIVYKAKQRQPEPFTYQKYFEYFR